MANAVSYVKEVGFVTNTTAGTTSSITVAAGGVPVDDHVVVYGACDNTGSGGAATTITVTDTRGNTYTTQSPQAIADPGAASAGIQGFFAVAKITTALQAGDTITITYGNSTAAKAINAQQFHGGNLTTAVLASSYSTQDNQTGTSSSVSATPTAAAQAVCALIAVEGGTADSFTQDSDTTNGSWTTLTRRGSGTTTSGATLNSVYKIVTASGAQTYNPTMGTARDHCAAILILDFEPGIPEGAVSGAIDWAGLITGDSPGAPELSYSKIFGARVVNHTNSFGSGDYTSASFTTQAGTLLMAIVGIDNQSAGGSTSVAAANIPAPVIGGVTGTKVSGASTDTTRSFSVRDHIYLFDNVTGGSKTISQSGTGTWDADINSIDVVVLEFTDAKAAAEQLGATLTSHTPQDSSTDPGSSTGTLNATPDATSIIVGAVSKDTINSSAINSNAAWTEIHEQAAGASGAGPFHGFQVQVRAAGSTSTSIIWDDLDVAGLGQVFDYSRVGMEILQADAAGSPPSEGTVDGAIGWAGTINGEMPSLLLDGSVEGAVGWVGTVNGARISLGSISGAVGWAGTVEGNAPSAHVIFDDFNRADSLPGGVALGSDWDSAGAFYISGNQAAKITGDHFARHLTSLDTPDQYAEVDVSAITGGSNRYFVVDVRRNDTNNDSYQGNIDPGTGQFSIGKLVGGTFTTLTTGGSAGSSHRLRLEAEGTALRLYVDGVLTLSTTDSSITTGDYVGLNSFTPDGGGRYDNFAAGPIVPPNGTVNGSITWAGEVDGEAPVGSGNFGAVSGAIGWAGTVTGARISLGSVSGAISWVGVITSFSGQWPSEVSGRKWLDQNGDVYLGFFFSSWGMPYQLTDAEITSELEKQAALGFKGLTIWIGGAAFDGTGWNQYTNEAAEAYWSGSPFQLANTSPSSLGPAWDTVDWIAQEARRLNLTVNMSFSYIGVELGDGHWTAATNTQMSNTGGAIANRYIDYPNICWHVMFDWAVTPASTSGQRIKALFSGINAVEGVDTRLRWVEVNAPNSTDEDGWYTDTDINPSANAWYNNNETNVANAVEIVDETYSELTAPVGDCEPPYDGNAHYTDHSANHPQNLRERSYATFIRGGMFENYGHEDYWPFGAVNGAGSEGLDWSEVMDDVHTLHQSYCWALLSEYVADLTWVPSSWVTTGVGTGETKAAVGSSDTAGIAYFPSSRTVVVDTTAISSTDAVRLRWYNPTSGSYTSIADYETPQTGRSVTYPSAHGDGTNDWALVVDIAPISLGSVSGNVDWAGTVNGTRTSSGSVSGAIGWVGTVTGSKPTKGAVNGAVDWAIGLVNGEREPKGDISGAINWTGVVVGGNLGFVQGAVGWAGTVTGERDPKGDVSGAVGWVGSVTGIAPAAGVADGSVNGNIGWVGTVTGAKASAGSVSGAISWTGVVVGGRLGVIVGAIGWVGTVTGKRSREGSLTGAISYVGSVTGETPSVAGQSGSVAGAIGWAGVVGGSVSKVGAITGAILWVGLVTSSFTIDPAIFQTPPQVTSRRPRIIVGRDAGEAKGRKWR